jgi:gag-polypeptide of LTR copia-type
MTNLETTKIISVYDPSSPYYVHPSDNPGTVLVVPVLDEDNYPTWKRSMTVALGVKNKLCFVDGTLDEPTAKDEKKAWQRCNHMVFSWLINALSKDLRDSVVFVDTSRTL